MRWLGIVATFVAACLMLPYPGRADDLVQILDATPISNESLPNNGIVPDPAHPASQPEYPSNLVKAGVEGVVILSFRVRADGSVDAQSVKVKSSSDVEALDQSAVREAPKWRFIPATENGRPVESDHWFRVVFGSDHDPPYGLRDNMVEGMKDELKSVGEDTIVPMDPDSSEGYAPSR